MDSPKTVEKEVPLKFKLNGEEINLEKNKLLFIGNSKYSRFDQPTDKKKISDPYQKLFFAKAALDNSIGYDWLIQGNNTPISPRQFFYCTKQFYKVFDPEGILDLVINHWSEDWYVSYSASRGIGDSGADVDINILITPLSEAAKQDKWADETKKRLNYFLEELKQNDDKPLFLGKDIKDGSMVLGLCVVEASGNTLFDNEYKVNYFYYNFIDRYTVVPAALEGTKKQRLATGVYRVKCKFVYAPEHTKRKFIEPYYLKIIEAHLVKTIPEDGPTNRLLTNRLLIVEDYTFDFLSKMNILTGKIKSIPDNLAYSINRFIHLLIKIVIYTLVILGLLGGLTQLPAILNTITNFSKFLLDI